jgi:hypothetical protein
MSDDPARDYEVLRRQTAAMLNLDLADLSPADGLRLDLTALLRLSLDSLQGAALAGREVDLSRLQSCFAMLQKLLPQSVAAGAARGFQCTTQAYRADQQHRRSDRGRRVSADHGA